MPKKTSWGKCKSKAFDHLSICKSPLSLLVQDIGPCTLELSPDLFDCLTRTIIAQFISTKAAETITKRIVSASGGTLFCAEGIRKVGQSGLKNLGLSTSKAKYILGVADLWEERKKNKLKAFSHEVDGVEEALSELSGVGPWTLDMVRIFALGHPNILPVGDYGLKSGIAALYGLKDLPDKNLIINLAKPWEPYRSFATWYIWHSKGSVPQS